MLLLLCIRFVDFGQLSRHTNVGRLRSGALAGFSVALADVIGHLRERSAGKENLVHASAFHRRRVVMCDGPASAAKHFAVARPALAQKIDNFREELLMSAIVTRNADGADIFLNRSADNVAD